MGSECVFGKEGCNNKGQENYNEKQQPAERNMEANNSTTVTLKSQKRKLTTEEKLFKQKSGKKSCRNRKEGKNINQTEMIY